MSVGPQIRRLRKAKSWTVAQLAVYADMSPSAVSQIETGRRSPTAASLEKLAEALEVEVRDLFPLGQPPLPELPDADKAERRRFWEEIKDLDADTLLEVDAALEKEVVELYAERAREGKTPFDFDPRLDTLLAKRVLVMLQRHALLRPGDRGRAKARDRQVAELVGAGT